MNVACIFPVANNLDKISDIFGVFESKIAPHMYDSGADRPSIYFAGTDHIYQDGRMYGESKGRGITNTIKRMPETPDMVISCDGSGKIPYDYVLQIYDRLVSDKNVSCVMANRGENKAINADRYLIERFEIYALKNYHSHFTEIPDGQCGLWGYKIGNGTEIQLTADGYDIELDLLGELFEKNLAYSFVDIELLDNQAARTAYSPAENFKKMQFLMAKYPGFGDSLPARLSEFEGTEEYRTLTLDSGAQNTWHNYKKGCVALSGKELFGGIRSHHALQDELNVNTAFYNLIIPA